MTNKEIYSDWVATQPQLPIFMQPWWLDAVTAGKEWDVLIYQQPESGQVLAALPYLLRKRLWVKYVIMPQETQMMGLWVDASLKDSDGVIRDKEIEHTLYKEFNAQLKALNLAYYYQQYPSKSPVPSEMTTYGYKVKKRVTYRLDNLTDLDKVIDGFSKNKKRQLQKALSLHCERGMSPEAFYAFHQRCLAERHVKIAYTREFLLVLERKTARLGCSDILSIRNADGEVYAAAYVVWDNKRMYYLIPAYSEAHKDSGAGALLVLEAIKLAREKGINFDFEGSMKHSTANHYKQFGSLPVTYYSVEKCYKWWFYFVLAFLWLTNRRFY